MRPDHKVLYSPHPYPMSQLCLESIKEGRISMIRPACRILKDCWLLCRGWFEESQALIIILSLLASDLTLITEKAESSPEHQYQFFLLFLVGICIIKDCKLLCVVQVGFFWPYLVVCGILAPQPGIEPVPPPHIGNSES